MGNGASSQLRYSSASKIRLALSAILFGFFADALAEPPPRSLDQALSDTLALGDAFGCGSEFGILNPDTNTEFETDQEGHDHFLVDLRDTGQLGRELTAVCGSSAVASAAALGGSLGSPQTTKTVSQFRLARRRVDSRLDLRGKRFGMADSIMLAEISEPVRPPATDASILQPEPQTGFGVFGQGEYERRDRETTPLEAGYEADISGGLLGVDYATAGGLVVGAWAGYRNTDADYTGVNLLVGSPELSGILNPGILADICNVSPAGGFDDKGARFGAFIGARFGRGFADLAVQYSRRDYDYRRNICAIETPTAAEPIVPDTDSPSGFSSPTTIANGGSEIDDIYAGTISGDTRLTERGVSARAGYDFGGDRLLWGPRISVNYLKSKIEAFTESGQTSVTNTVESNTPFDEINDPRGLTTTRATGDPTGLELAFGRQSRTSLQTEAQLVVGYRFEPGFAAIIPRVSASWIHEFKGERELVTVRMAQDFRPTPTRFSFTTDSLDKDKGILSIGVSAFVGGRFTADLEVSHLIADDKFDSTAVTAQARWGF